MWVSAKEAGGFGDKVPACSDAGGAVKSGNERVVFYRRMKNKVFTAAGNGVAVAHDGAQLTSGVVCKAGTIAFITAAIVDGATGPAAPVGVVGSTIVTHLVGDHVQVPGVGVDVVARGAGKVAADTSIEAVAQAIEVCDATGPNVGPHGQEVFQVQRYAVEIGVVVPL